MSSLYVVLYFCHKHLPDREDVEQTNCKQNKTEDGEYKIKKVWTVVMVEHYVCIACGWRGLGV